MMMSRRRFLSSSNLALVGASAVSGRAQAAALPEHTTGHWHGMRVPSGMDGVGGLSQPYIEPGQTFVYEFTVRDSGTFMYHPHADEMVQMAMGMMGTLVVHPRDPRERRVDRDF